MSYTYDYDDEEEQYGTEPAPITQMPVQNIPATNTDAQQYPDVSTILRENEQLKAMVANFEQKLASHQLLPPKATPHVSYLQCSYPREFSLYYLIHYFSIKISKDKQAQPIDFTTFAPLSNISALNMLDTVLRSASHIFQPAVIINSQDGGFTNRAGHTYSLTHPISCLGLLQNPAQAIYNAAFEARDSDYIQFVVNRDCPFIVALRHSELTAPPNTQRCQLSHQISRRSCNCLWGQNQMYLRTSMLHGRSLVCTSQNQRHYLRDIPGCRYTIHLQSNQGYP